MQNFANTSGAVRRKIDGDAAGHDPVHHQTMAETGGGGAQNLLAQDAAMRVHQRERGVVADGADIAEMVGQPLQFRHQRAQVTRPWWRLDVERGLDRLRKGDAVGDGAVAGRARGKPRRPLDGRAGHQRLDAFVHVAEPLLEAHHRLAAAGEAEVAGLDNAGMDRADRNLVERFAFDGQKGVGGTFGRCRRARAERMLHVPEAEIEPGPRVERADRLESIEAVNGAFEPDRRRMQRTDRGKFSVRDGEADDRDVVA